MNITTSLSLVFSATAISSVLMLSSCSSLPSYESNASLAPVMAPSNVYKAKPSSTPSGSMERLAKSRRQTIVKSGRVGVEVADIKAASMSVEKTVESMQGYMTSMSSSRSDSQGARFQIRVPANKLDESIAAFETLGKLKYSNIVIEDVSAQKVKYQARLRELKLRRSRISALLRSAKTVKEKLEVEALLSELESQIFTLEEAAKEQAKHSAYSKLSLNLTRKSIAGPVGAVWKGFSWGVSKLFVIQE